MSDITHLLSQVEHGDREAANQLFTLVYEELRKLASGKLAQEQSGQTLQATALVHEAYIKLIASGNSQPWNSRGHFFSAAAESMRRILIDLARRKNRPKHGGDRQRVNLDDAVCLDANRAAELLALDAALEKLAAESPEKAHLVKLRYFAGLSHQDAALALGISRATADRHWAYARAFLRCELEEAGES
jgi:RNA polymerase sigma factor (TIGR02999 family)